MQAAMLRHRIDPHLAGLPPGQRAYAVGDVHGHLDRLLRVHDAIRADLQARPCGDAVVVHLGDYIDRGPNSAGVVEHLLAGPPAPGVAVVNLMGNHEAMLLAALQDGGAEAVDNWLSNGGLDSLRSWGIAVRGQVRDWAGLLPPGHLRFLRGLLPHWSCGGALFVHAGVRPGVPLAEQVPDDLLWIREAFLRWRGTMLPEAPDALVVHGHTPSPQPELRPNRLGLDTGAGRGGPLTCAVLEGMEAWFIQG
jgi:serine/threonine protein phosphatase 1